MVNHPDNEGELMKSATIKAKDLAPAVRQRVAMVLHVDLADDDELTLALLRAAEVQRSTHRTEARQRLLAVLAKMDEKTRDVPEQEIEEAIEEAMQFVRSHPDD
jgi:hypothetical protein